MCAKLPVAIRDSQTAVSSLGGIVHRAGVENTAEVIAGPVFAVAAVGFLIAANALAALSITCLGAAQSLAAGYQLFAGAGVGYAVFIMSAGGVFTRGAAQGGNTRG